MPRMVGQAEPEDPRPRRAIEAVQQAFPGCERWHRLTVYVPSEVASELKSYAKQERVTPSVLAAVALGTFLARLDRSGGQG